MNPNLALMLAELALAAGEPATVDIPNVVVTWQAPADCPGPKDVQARLQHLLRDSSATARERPLAVHGRVLALASGGFELELTTKQGAEEYSRTLRASTCNGITDAGALVVAIAIDPELAERDAEVPVAAEEQPSAPAPAVAAAASNEPSEPPRTATRPKGRTREVELGLAAGVLLDGGTLPGFGYGPSLTFLASSGPFSLELSGLGLLPRTATLPGEGGKGGQISLIAADLRACGHLGRLVFDVRGCAELELGRTHAESFGAEVNGSENQLWLAPGAGFVGVRQLRDWVSWRLQVLALFPARRPEFIIENAGSVHQASPIVLRVGLGIEAIF